jgi:hypothetical protein
MPAYPLICSAYSSISIRYQLFLLFFLQEKAVSIDYGVTILPPAKKRKVAKKTTE